MSIPPVSAIGRMRPGELTEAASPLSRATRSEKSRNRGTISPSTVLDTIERHVLLDGFRIVVDLEKSRGSYLYNAVDDRRLIDLYGFFGSMPVGFNHPHFDGPNANVGASDYGFISSTIGSPRELQLALKLYF